MLRKLLVVIMLAVTAQAGYDVTMDKDYLYSTIKQGYSKYSLKYIPDYKNNKLPKHIQEGFNYYQKNLKDYNFIMNMANYFRYEGLLKGLWDKNYNAIIASNPKTYNYLINVFGRNNSATDTFLSGELSIGAKTAKLWQNYRRQDGEYVNDRDTYTKRFPADYRFKVDNSIIPYGMFLFFLCSLSFGLLWYVFEGLLTFIFGFWGISNRLKVFWN